MGKCNKTHGMGKVWEIDTHTFSIVWVLFSHQIPILWYTSSYGKCMCFPINFSQYGKMQQNPSYGLNLGNWYLYFSYSMGEFSPYNFHPTVYLSYRKCMGFPINFPQYRKIQQNSSYGESLRNWCLYFSYIMDAFFLIRFPFYGILHHMGNACVFSLMSHNMGKDSQTY